MGSLSQSGVILGAIFAAFFVFITRKGELPTYAGLLLLSPGTASSGNAAQQAAQSGNALVNLASTTLGLGLY